MLKQNQQLTPHFSLNEFLKSETAVRRNIDNTPKPIHIDNMRALCNAILEPLRDLFGPIIITSGYRSPHLNLAVGGSLLSQHTKGEAADIQVGTLSRGRRMFEWIRKNLLFDQLILERSTKKGTLWLHVSFKKERKLNRKEAFEAAA